MPEETIAGLFRDYEQADRAVERLVEAGFSKDNIGILARREILDAYDAGHKSPKEVAGGAGAGAVAGGATGGLIGLLAGIGAIVIPGLGPVLAAGAVAAAWTAVGMASVGAAVGGILGAMLELSIPEDEAHVFAEGVKRGGVLIVVQTTEERAGEAESIIRQAGAFDIEELRQEWREKGWDRFDHSQNPDEDYYPLTMGEMKEEAE